MEEGSIFLILVVTHLDFTFSAEGRTQGLEDVMQVPSSKSHSKPLFYFCLYFIDTVLHCDSEKIRLEKAMYDLA